MASGHANHTKRPNTWPHRPTCDVKKVLANSEPSTHGSRTLRNVRFQGRAASMGDRSCPRADMRFRELPRCKITPRFALLRERSEQDPLPPTRFQPSSLPCADTVELSVRERSRQAQQPKVGSSHLL